MTLLPVLEWLFIIAVIWFLITQIALPTWRNEPWFPRWRRRHELERARALAAEKVGDAEISEETERLNREAAARDRRAQIELKQGGSE